jgi:hypothetical protein
MRANGLCFVALSIVMLPGFKSSSLAQESTVREPAPAQWVPFVAQIVEESRTDYGRLTVTGAYVRNRDGSSFRRITAHFTGSLPLVGVTDQGILYLRPQHVTYHIDFQRKSVTRQIDDVAKHPELGPDPMTRDEFDKQHTIDDFLGKQVISGVECEGYRIHHSRKKKKNDPEAWFAPSLNFLVIKSQRRTSEGFDVVGLIDDLQPGKEPDPAFFRLPEGFKLVK